MRICYVFASRSRPKRFFAALDNIRYFSTSNDYFVWAKLDDDDSSMNNDEVIEELKKYPEVTVKWGLSKSKIHAINRSCEDLPECDILIMMSDDIVWDVKGFDEIIREAFMEHFPNLDGTVHFPDDHGKHFTIIVSILGINLYKQLGYLYFFDYTSVFADNDFTEMTRLMNKYVYVNKRLFTHAHPIWGGVDWDLQYHQSESRENYTKDHMVFLTRQSNNFGL